jgi:integrase
MGMVYRQSGRNNWMIKYYRDGRSIAESARTVYKTAAKKLLRQREAAVDKGLPIDGKIGKLRFEDAADDLRIEYRVNRRRSIDELERRIDLHLMPFFQGRRMATITAAEVRRYIDQRQADTIVVQKARRLVRPGRGRQPKDGRRPPTIIEVPEVRRGVSNAEINRELTALKRIFSLAIENGKLLHRPHIPMLTENNVRTGFFEADEFRAVEAHLPPELRPVVRFAYITGWRVASEILPLQWRHVDLKAGEVRLDAGTTKNREGRVFKLTTELRQLLDAQKAATDALQRAGGKVIPSVFHRQGEPIRTLTKAWRAACRAAGCPGRIPHDLRRTAVRNMVRAGVPERVAMKLTGHKTRSVFERYNIVSDGDLDAAAARLSGLDDDLMSAAPFGAGRRVKS